MAPERRAATADAVFDATLADGITAARAGDWRRARSLLSRAHLRRPRDPRAIYWLAAAQYHLGNIRETRELLEPLAERDVAPLPERPAAIWELLARCHLSSNTDEACRLARQGIGKDPDDPCLAFVLATALHRARRLQEAWTHFRRAWKLEREAGEQPAYPAHPGMVPYSLSTVLVEMKRWKESLEAVEAAIQREPDHALYHNRKGVILFEGLGRAEDAVAAVEEAIRLDPQTRTSGLDGLFHHNHALYLKSLGRYADALAAVERAIRISPRSSYKSLAHELRGAAAQEAPSFETAAASSDLDWTAVGGMGGLKKQVRRILDVILTRREEARRYGIVRNGILLHGPPGCGKTFFARATAGEFGLELLRVPLGSAQTKYVGAVGEKIQKLFQEARAKAPCLLFFDEFDAVAADRDDATTGHDQQLVNALLQQVDACREVPGLVLMAATNRLEAIDPAAIREGRFDYKVRIPKPDFDARREIVQVLLAERPVAPGLDPTQLAQDMEGFTAAQVRHVVDEAAMLALEAGAPIAEGHLRQAYRRHVTSQRFDGKKLGWDDLVLPAETKRRLMLVERLMEAPELARELGVQPPTGLLLHGPPGTGKTTVARVLASETEASFFSLNASDVFSKWLGESEHRVQELFERARDSVPAIVFLDEAEALLGRRGEGSSGAEHARNAVVNTFLAAMDGLESDGRVFVVAATNRPELLDDALLRPGRLGEAVEIGLPDAAGRQALLELFTRPMPLHDDVDLAHLAAETGGASGADLEGLCRSAGRNAFLRELEEQDDEHIVCAADFEGALEEIFPERAWSPEERRIGFN